MKSILYYGVFRSPFSPVSGTDPYVVRMGVTSFKRLRSGTLMAYGRLLENNESTSRQADGMFFYMYEEQMNSAIAAANHFDSISGVRREELNRALRSYERERRVELGRLLGIHAVVPDA